MVSIATWNVNSIKARLPHLLEWLRSDKPDIVLLQELKCVDEAFPALEIEELGYNLAVHGQKTYNGVAILSKFPLEDVTRGLPGNADDTQARYVEAVASLPGSAIRVASVYVPNGQEVGSDKYAYKLRFLDALRAHLANLLTYDEVTVIGGDYNIAPFDADVHNPKAWAESVLCHPEVRSKLRSILNFGYTDALAATLPSPLAPRPYTWWDYRSNAFAADDGLRIDHLLLSPQATDSLKECHVEKSLRALEKPSDHAPVVATLKV